MPDAEFRIFFVLGSSLHYSPFRVGNGPVGCEAPDMGPTSGSHQIKLFIQIVVQQLRARLFRHASLLLDRSPTPKSIVSAGLGISFCFAGQRKLEFLNG